MPELILPHLVTTTLEIPGYRLVRNIGITRGLTVRSLGITSGFAAGIERMFGGKQGTYTELCQQARSEAFKLMLEYASALGGNAIIGFRYETNEIMDGLTEVLAYGTAVWAEPISSR